MQRGPIALSLAQYGISPQRNRSSERRPSRSRWTTGRLSVGAPLYVGAVFGIGLTVSNSTRISPSGVFWTTRPHILLLLPRAPIPIFGARHHTPVMPSYSGTI